MFVKKGISEATVKIFIDSFHIVYSDETLKEIQRSSGYEDKFLEVLRKLDAFHLKIVVKQPGFVITDQATLSNTDPFQVFNEFCENTSLGVGVEDVLKQELLKFSGGRKGDSIADIHEEALNKLPSFKKEILKNFKGIWYLLRIPLFFIFEYESFKLKRTFKLYREEMSKHVPDTRDWNGMYDFRSATGLDPKILNNIEPPNVIEKIWNLYEGFFTDTDRINDLEDLFLIKSNIIYADRSIYTHQKITMMYHMLNTIGYEPDSKLHKEKRLIASLSDGSHSSVASFCNVFMSKDKSLVLKTRAIYEYLQVKTEVVHFTELLERSKES